MLKVPPPKFEDFLRLLYWHTNLRRDTNAVLIIESFEPHVFMILGHYASRMEMLKFGRADSR